MSLEEQVHQALEGQPPEAGARGHVGTKFAVSDFPAAFELPWLQVLLVGPAKVCVPDLGVSHSFLWEDLFIFNVSFFFLLIHI